MDEIWENNYLTVYKNNWGEIDPSYWLCISWYIFHWILCEKIKYDDGDVEVLCLDKERWELVENGRKTAKVWTINYIFSCF